MTSLYFKQEITVNGKKIQRELVSRFKDAAEAEHVKECVQQGLYNDETSTLTFLRAEHSKEEVA